MAYSGWEESEWWEPDWEDDQPTTVVLKERTRRGGRSWQRKMRREKRIRQQMMADQVVSDNERETYVTQAERPRWTAKAAREQLAHWASGGLEVPNASDAEAGPENRAEFPDPTNVQAAEENLKVEAEEQAAKDEEAETAIEEVSEVTEQGDPDVENEPTSPAEPTPSHAEDTSPDKTEENMQKSVTRVSVTPSPDSQEPVLSPETEEAPEPSSPTESVDPTTPTEEVDGNIPRREREDYVPGISAKAPAPQAIAPALHTGAPGSNDEKENTRADERAAELCELIPPKELAPAPKRQRVPEPVEPPVKTWPKPAPPTRSTASSSSTKPSAATTPTPPSKRPPAPSYSRIRPHFCRPIGIAVTDLHKVLDTDRGHIRRTYSREFKRAFDEGILVHILSYIGRTSDDKRDDAYEKVEQFNKFLASVMPQYIDTPYLPVPLYICDHRCYNKGKLSTLQRWYEQDDDEPKILGMIDDAPDVCEEMEKGNVRAYRVYGGSKHHQLHEDGKPVFRDFPQAMNTLIEDFHGGAVPLRQKKQYGDRKVSTLGADPEKPIDRERYSRTR